jgi:hypothetical protein
MTTKMTAKQIIAAAYEMANDAAVVAEAAADIAKCPGMRHDLDPVNYITEAARSVVRRPLAEQQKPVRGFAKMVAAHRIATA